MPIFFASLVSDPLTNGEFNRKWKLLPCSVACESPRPVRRRSPRSQPQLFDGALLLLWKAVSDLSFCLRHWGPLPSSTTWEAVAESMALYFNPSVSLPLPIASRMFRSLTVRFSPVFRSRQTHLSRFSTSTITSKMSAAANLGGHGKKHKVTVVGSGNW